MIATIVGVALMAVSVGFVLGVWFVLSDPKAVNQ